MKSQLIINFIGIIFVFFLGIAQLFYPEQSSIFTTGFGGLICIVIGFIFIFYKPKNVKRTRVDFKVTGLLIVMAACFAILVFLKDNKNEEAKREMMQYLNQHVSMKGTVIASYDHSTNSYLVVVPIERDKMKEDEQMFKNFVNYLQNDLKIKHASVYWTYDETDKEIGDFSAEF